MLPLLFRLLHTLNWYASAGLKCDGRPVYSCSESLFYTQQTDVLTQIESRILEHTEHLSPSAMENIQLVKIRSIFDSAKHIPFWNPRPEAMSILSRRVRSMSALKQLPILTRADIQRGFKNKNTLNETIPKRRRAFAQTSGSTGEPLFVYLDTIVVCGRRARFRRKIKWLSGGTSTLVVKGMGAAPLGFTNFKGVRFFTIRNDKNSNSSLADMCVLLRGILHHTSDAIIIDTYPSNVMRLVPILLQSGIDTSRILGFVCGGEALLPGEREYVRTTLGCDIRSYYASTEFEIIGQECGQSPEHAFHVNAEYFYVEIVDEKGNPLPRNETGRVIITSLEHEAQPFIRYDTGDLGHLLAQPCSCGRTLPLLVVEGRQANLIRLPNGRSFTQFNVIGHFYNPEVVSQIRQFQVVHERPDVFTIKLVPQSTTVEQQERAIEILKARLLETFGEDTHVSFEIIDSIPVTERGKSIGYVSNF